MNIGGSAPSITVYSHGGSGIARVDKRDTAKCDGFTFSSFEASESETVQVFSIVDCTNRVDSRCTITVGDKHTKSVFTSYSASAGGGIEGVYSVEVTFGQEYTDSETTSIQEGFSVQARQQGYLSAYSAATLFTGTYTGYNSGDVSQPGQVLALKSNGFTYMVVNTST